MRIEAEIVHVKLICDATGFEMFKYLLCEVSNIQHLLYNVKTLVKAEYAMYDVVKSYVH